MSKEQFDHIEDRIREAAENSVPAFNEEAWTDMNKLLDKEYSDKRRRRIFLWLWSSLVGLLLVIIVVGFFSGNTDRRNKSNSEKAVLTGEAYSKTTGGDRQGPLAATLEGAAKLPNSAGHVNRGSIFSLSAKQHESVIGKERIPLASPFVDKIEKQTQIPVNLDTVTVDSLIVPVFAADSLPQAPVSPVPKDTVSMSGKRPPSRGLYLVAYGGADNNGTRILENGLTTLRAGISVGYRLNDRVSLQLGFYAGKKKYKAEGGDYEVKQGSYLSVVNLTNVKADCAVFEIPLAIRYDLLSRKKYMLYGVASLSSYIMKKEYYDYYYIKNGMPGATDWTYKGNKHLFSIVGLSLGYEQRLSNIFSLVVEPSVRVPLSGIGEGKVKLYSTGLLLGLKYNLSR